MISLSDFVSSTLVQIVDGVVKAQEIVKTKGARINPKHVIIGNEILVSTLHNQDTQAIADMIEFDLLITAEKAKDTKGTIGIVMASIGLGTEGHSKTKNTEQNRIKFRVPLELPQSD